MLSRTQRTPLIGQALIDTVGRKPTCEGIGFVDTIGITIEADTGLTDNESKRQFKCDLKAIIVGIKSYRINKNKNIKDINIELGVK